MLGKYFLEIQGKFLTRSADIVCNGITIDWYDESLLWNFFFFYRKLIVATFFVFCFVLFLSFWAATLLAAYSIAYKVYPFVLNLWMSDL